MGLEQFVSACLRVCRAGILVSCLVSGLAWLAHTDAHPRGRTTLAANGSLPGTKANHPAQARLVETYGKLPLSFEANRGQTDKKVRFLARGRDYALFLTATDAVLSFRKQAEPGSEAGLSHEAQASGRGSGGSAASPPSGLVEMKLVGANRTPEVSGLERSPSTANYFIGNDPKGWRTNVPTYAKVRYKDVYPGIDLVYYGNQGQLEYDFVVEPRADPRMIRLSLQGGGRLKLDAHGDLVLGEVRFRRPRLYQEAGGRRHDIPGRYVLKGANE